MRNQLAHLLDFAERAWVKIRCCPSRPAPMPGCMGSFNLLRFEDDPDLVYTEDFVQGHMTANPQALREGSLRYDHLQAAALSVEDSAALIARVMEERYGHQPGPDEARRGVSRRTAAAPEASASSAPPSARPPGASRRTAATHGGDCVEVAASPAAVAVRDSKNPDGPAFAVTPAAFAAFVAAAADGEFHN